MIKSTVELEKIKAEILPEIKIREDTDESKRDQIRVLIPFGVCSISAGAESVVKEFQTLLKKYKLENVKIVKTGCHGFCQTEPNVIICPGHIFYIKVEPKDVKEIVEQHLLNGKIVEILLYEEPRTKAKIAKYDDIPFYKKQQRIVLRNCGLINPENIEEYIARDGYFALEKALRTKPEEIIEEVKKSGLRGRGGAGFPTWKKWKICSDMTNNKKYIIANGDEGDPGAFMDRSLMEGDPHAIIEGMIIAGYALGAPEGCIYARAEYPLAVKRLKIAIEQAEKYSLLGENIFGKFNFKITLNEGAGAFVCGEETALIASIEGKRGFPKPRPPFPAVKGLFGKPTVINNVETLANIPKIILNGGEWFAKIGCKTSTGTKIFALTGCVNNTGLIEVPMGILFRDIIFELGGGILGNREFKAVQTGGPSGGCLPKELLGLEIDYDSLTRAGSIMGSGGLVVMDENTCVVDVAKFFLNFTKKESCGKCTPCREGTTRMHEIIEKITNGKGKEEEVAQLAELGRAIAETSLCGLGKTAPNPALTTLRYFLHEYEQHIKYKKCPATVCKEIISSPCQHVCPIGTEAPVYIALIAKGRFEEAFEIIRKDNPLPSVCARVCHHPCEFKCQSGKWGDPIAIRALKRFVTDYALKTGLKSAIKKKGLKKKKVAIIGSGPAGLTAGYYLAEKGYDVTIFESLPVVGGALAVCIPEYRLSKNILNIDIQNIKKAGVKIKTNVTVGRDVSFNKLLKDYNAIFIATGAHKSIKLGIPNEDADSVLYSMEFLKDINLKRKVKIGKQVGVIGGGNAAVDAARVAKRITGCEKISIIYRRTQAEMPAFKEEVDAASEEGIKMQFLTAPTKILTKNRKLGGIECIKMKLGEMDESGRRRPVPIKGSEFIIELDTLIVAIGEQPDISFLDVNKFEISKRNTIVVNPETFATNINGVFACGDVVTGPNTVIEAIASGKVAAEMVDKYLQRKPLVREYEVTRPSMYIEPIELTEKEVAEAKKPKIPCLSVKKRVNNFNEVELALTKNAAVKEARRCLRCDLETEEGKKQFELRR